MTAPAFPLAGLRVVDMADGKGEMCGRYLADLGAEVILVEPPGGAPTRVREPRHDGVSLYFATHQANKLGVVIDVAELEGRDILMRLLATADIWIESTAPGALAALGLDPADVRRQLPELVIVSITDFGQTGPRTRHGRDGMGADGDGREY